MLLKSIHLINSFFSAVVVAFLLELISVAFPVPGPVRLVLWTIVIPLKIVLFSGAFGVLADMASGKADYCTKKNFSDSVLRLGPLYVLWSSGVVGIHFWLMSCGLGNGLILPVFQAAFDGIFLFWVAFLALRFPSSTILSILKNRLLGSDIATVVLIYIAQLALAGVAFQGSGVWGLGAGAALLAAKYLQFGLFACWLFILVRPAGIPAAPSDSRELILVNPLGIGLANQLFVLFSDYPPVFLVLKALTPASYRIREFNQRLWHDSYYKKDALVAITFITMDSPRAYQIARGFKKAGAKVVLGGPHATMLPEEAREFCDSVVIGAAEGVWEEIIHDYENNSLKPVYQGSAPADKLKKVDRYLLNCPVEQVKGFVETSRGCKFACDFCSIHAQARGLIRRDLDTVVELARRLGAKKKEIGFLDVNIYADPDHMEAVLKAITPLRIRWRAFISIDVALDDNMVKLIKESGCSCLVIGYEIHGESLVSRRGGKLALARRYLELTRKFRKYGIGYEARFMFGFDEDDWRELVKLWLFALRLKPELASLAILQPFPGTRIYRDLVAEGRITNLSWEYYGRPCFVFDHAMAGALWAVPIWVVRYVCFMLSFNHGKLIVTCAIILAWFLWQLFLVSRHLPY